MQIQPVSPVTETADTESDTIIIDSTWLEQKLQSTTQWINQSATSLFTLQLMLIDDWATDDLINSVAQMSMNLDLEKIHIYQTSIRGRKVYSVLYSEYAQREDATEQLRQLPDWLRRSSPYLRTLKGIKSDLDRHSSNSTLAGETTP